MRDFAQLRKVRINNHSLYRLNLVDEYAEGLFYLQIYYEYILFWDVYHLKKHQCCLCLPQEVHGNGLLYTFYIFIGFGMFIHILRTIIYRTKLRRNFIIAEIEDEKRVCCTSTFIRAHSLNSDYFSLDYTMIYSMLIAQFFLFANTFYF